MSNEMLNNILENLISELGVPWAEDFDYYAMTGTWNALSVWGNFREAGQAQIAGAEDVNYRLAVWARTTRRCLEHAELLSKEGDEIPGGPHEAAAQNFREQATASLKGFEYFQGVFKSFSEPENP